MVNEYPSEPTFSAISEKPGTEKGSGFVSVFPAAHHGLALKDVVSGPWEKIIS